MADAGSRRPDPAAPTDPWGSPDPPFRVTRPMLYQGWRDCAFLHWSFAPQTLRPHVPPDLELDTHEGRAWVGSISFAMPTIRPGSLSATNASLSAAESHLRTYVVDAGGRRGIWMLSLDIDPLAAAVTGRFGFALPYWWATMDVKRGPDMARYFVRRRIPGDGRLELELDVGEPVPDGQIGASDHFLTARWILYAGAAGITLGMLTEHPRWRFRRAAVRQLDQTLLEQVGLPEPDGPPVVHFSDGVDALISWPRPLRQAWNDRPARVGGTPKGSGAPTPG